MYAQERGLPQKGHPQNCAIAKSYLREARELGHPAAARELSRIERSPACRQYGVNGSG